MHITNRQRGGLMRFKNKFSKQEESLIKNFQQKTEQLNEEHLTIRRQQNLRKIRSLNLLKALGSEIVENKHDGPAVSSTLDTSKAQHP